MDDAHKELARKACARVHAIAEICEPLENRKQELPESLVQDLNSLLMYVTNASLVTCDVISSRILKEVDGYAAKQRERSRVKRLALHLLGDSSKKVKEFDGKLQSALDEFNVRIAGLSSISPCSHIRLSFGRRYKTQLNNTSKVGKIRCSILVI